MKRLMISFTVVVVLLAGVVVPAVAAPDLGEGSDCNLPRALCGNLEERTSYERAVCVPT